MTVVTQATPQVTSGNQFDQFLADLAGYLNDCGEPFTGTRMNLIVEVLDHNERPYSPQLAGQLNRGLMNALTYKGGKYGVKLTKLEPLKRLNADGAPMISVQKA